MQDFALLMVLAGLVAFSGYKYYKTSRARTLYRQRHK